MPSGWVSDQERLKTWLKSGSDMMEIGSWEKNYDLMANGQGQEIKVSLVFFNSLRWEKTGISI